MSELTLSQLTRTPSVGCALSLTPDSLPPAVAEPVSGVLPPALLDHLTHFVCLAPSGLILHLSPPWAALAKQPYDAFKRIVQKELRAAGHGHVADVEALRNVLFASNLQKFGPYGKVWKRWLAAPPEARAAGVGRKGDIEYIPLHLGAYELLEAEWNARAMRRGDQSRARPLTGAQNTAVWRALNEQFKDHEKVPDLDLRTWEGVASAESVSRNFMYADPSRPASTTFYLPSTDGSAPYPESTRSLPLPADIFLQILTILASSSSYDSHRAFHALRHASPALLRMPLPTAVWERVTLEVAARDWGLGKGVLAKLAEAFKLVREEAQAQSGTEEAGVDRARAVWEAYESDWGVRSRKRLRTRVLSVLDRAEKLVGDG